MEKIMELWKKVSGFVLAVSCIPAAIGASSPVGQWTTIDDKTGAKRAIVTISESGDTLIGIIDKVYPQPGDSGICDNCPGSFKGKKIQGLRFLWGLKNDGKNQWSGGSILDPKSGKVYKVKATLENNKFQVRGYLGVALLGRTQTWIR
jgi:uncharacterized protein (DUF2147 family)